MNPRIAGVSVPQTELARGALGAASEALPDFVLRHAMRSFFYGALIGEQRGIDYDTELLYVAAAFHMIGLADRYHGSSDRFEIDSANCARRYLQSANIDAVRCRLVWDAVALHATPGIAQHMSTEIALLSAGVGLGLQGAGYVQFRADWREDVERAFPRGEAFKTKILDFFARGLHARPETTYGNYGADVLDRAEPDFLRRNFCGAILGAKWTQ